MRDDGQHSLPGVDLFLQNVKLQGEAVRKSGKRLTASVLFKKEGRSEQTRLGATTDSMLSELVVSLKGENQTGEEFHLNVLVQLVKLLLLRSQNVRERKRDFLTRVSCR